MHPSNAQAFFLSLMHCVDFISGWRRQQPHYGNDEAAQHQRLREAFDLNERLRQNEIASGARLRTGTIRDAGVRAAPPAPINPTLAKRNQLEQRLLEAQQKVVLERMGLMQEHQRHMRMYQAERQGAVGGFVGGGGGGIPAMGYNAALGMPMVPQGFDGSRYQPMAMTIAIWNAVALLRAIMVDFVFTMPCYPQISTVADEDTVES